MKDINIAEPITPSITARGVSRNGVPQVRLFFESGVDEGAYYPASDVQVYGLAGVQALKEFCDKILESCKA